MEAATNKTLQRTVHGFTAIELVLQNVDTQAR